MIRRVRPRLAIVAVMAMVPMASPLPAQEDSRSLRQIGVAVADAEGACRADDGRLWGISLCGPLLFADTGEARLIASHAAPGTGLERTSEGLYVGPLPDDFLAANRAIEWAGVQWAMVVLPLPDDPADRRELLMHESFHRIQGDLGLTTTEHAMDHLAGEEGRVWLRLELRALARALATDSAGGHEALRDALAFRARRQALVPGAHAAETALELQEGLAAYTGAVLALAVNDSVARVVKLLGDFDDHDSYARSFAYATGPALGFLADRYAPGWRERIRETRDLAGVLERVWGTGPGVVLAELETRARAYGFEEIAAEESERRREAERVLADYRRRLVEGPVLVLPLREMQMTFDPSAVTPLGGEGMVYPKITLRDRWGTLIVEDGGALISADFTRVTVPVTGGGVCTSGAGWSLDLREGWVVVSDEPREECRLEESRKP